MINKILLMFLTCSIMTYSQYKPTYTKSAVAMAGSLVSSQHNVDTKKYKRKDCPVCKGKGYYISGDGISRVTCGYCEIESESNTVNTIKKETK